VTRWIHDERYLTLSTRFKPSAGDGSLSLSAALGDSQSLTDRVLSYYCNEDLRKNYREAEDRLILELSYRNVSDPSVLGPISPDHYLKFINPPKVQESEYACAKAAESRIFARIIRDVHRRHRESRAKWYERQDFLSPGKNLFFYDVRALERVAADRKAEEQQQLMMNGETLTRKKSTTRRREVVLDEEQEKEMESASSSTLSSPSLSSSSSTSPSSSKKEHQMRVWVHNLHTVRDGFLENDEDLLNAYDELEDQRLALVAQACETSLIVGDARISDYSTD
ncbi:unnamed protein product, partial [Amoebophrya sp. A25]